MAAELYPVHIVLVQALGPVLFLHLPLNWQAMAVPAGDVVRVAAQHLVGAVDDVLQDLVQAGADVQVAIGIGRPIVQDELLAPLAGVPLAVEQVHGLPALQDQRLPLGQAGAHGKFGFRQEYRAFVIGCHVSSVSRA